MEFEGSGHLKKKIKEISKLKLSFLGIVEPFCSQKKLMLLRSRLKFTNGISNEDQGEKLWLFWDHGWTVRVVSCGDQHITVFVLVNGM